MKIPVLVAALTFAVSSLAWAADQAQTYKIDTQHTSVIFKINHLGFSNVVGHFSGVEGTFTVDSAKPEKSSLSLTIPADTVATFVEKRDSHLKSPDFFNVKQFPTITFKSKSVKKTGAKTFEIAGDLTLHGITKPITMKFTQFNTGKDPWGGTRTGGEATFKIKRSEFDMKFLSKPGEVGDEVELTANVEGSKT